MSEQLLLKILDEISGIKEEVSGIKEEIQIMKSQIDENTQLINSIIHRQVETDSKLDAVSMEVHKTYGVLTEHDEKLD